jgi:hypothetical protein
MSDSNRFADSLKGEPGQAGQGGATPGDRQQTEVVDDARHGVSYPPHPPGRPAEFTPEVD